MVENEVQFLSWDEFRRMGPSILRLEISRLERLTRVSCPDSELYNALVMARFELSRLVSVLDRTEAPVEHCADHLRKALLSLSFASAEGEDEVSEALHPILSRLHYLHHRMELVY